MNVVLTVLLNTEPDPQRGTRLAADPDLIRDLRRSVAPSRLIVFTDCLAEGTDGNVDWVRVPGGGNPYFRRWELYADWLDRHDVGFVWCVDGTDVEQLNPPWRHMQPGVLYVGSEDSAVGVPWMRIHHPAQAEWIEANAHRRLLNAGIAGGDRGTVLRLARQVAAAPHEFSDMAAFNQAVYELWPDHVTGDLVHTPYKAYARTGRSWWRHK